MTELWTNSPSAVLEIAHYIDGFAASPLARWRALAPWELCGRSADVVRELLAELPADEFVISDEVAVHRKATVEDAAVLKGPLIRERR
jgi:hypothetical protein